MDRKRLTKFPSKYLEEYYFKQKLVFIFIAGFCLGVLTSSFPESFLGKNFSTPLVSIFLLLIAGSVIFAEKIWNKKIEKGVFVISLLFISFALGSLRYDVKDFHVINPALESRVGEKIEVVGTVVSEPERKENSISFIIESKFENLKKDKILVYSDLYSQIKYGDEVKVEGKLQVPGIIDDGENKSFDYGTYLSKDDIFYTVSFASVEKISSGKGSKVRSTLLEVKGFYVEKITEVLPEPKASLLAGLTVSGKSALIKDTVDEFRRAGLIHIVVLSGYHVTLVTYFIFLILSFFLYRFRHGSKLARVLTILSLGIFVLMAGASASILRAALMALVAVGGKILQRDYNAPRALIAAAFVLVLINPKILVFDAGFHLSFLATAGIIYLFPLVNIYLGRVPHLVRWRYVRELLAITISAQIAVSPYLLYAMGNVSLVSLVSNVLVVPVVPFAMLFGFISALIAFASLTLATPFAYISYILLSWILGVSSFLGNLSFALLVTPAFPFWMTLVAYIFIVGIFLHVKRGFYNIEKPPAEQMV